MNLVLLVLIASLSLPALLEAQTPDKIRIGISSSSPGFLPTVVAEKKGLYAKYGLGSEHIEAAFFNGAMAEELRSKGFHILADLYKANIRTLGSGIIVKRTTLQQNRDLAANVLKATFEGLALVKSAAGKPVVVKTLMRRLKISDPAVAEQGYYYLQRDLDTQVSPAVEGLENLQRFMKTYNPRVGDVNVANLVDTRLVKYLSDTGFIDQISRIYGLK